MNEKIEVRMNRISNEWKILFAKFVKSIDLLLMNEIAEWAETNFDVVRYLNEKEFTRSIVTSFKSLFQDRFLSKIIDNSVFNFDVELNNFKKKSIQYILLYYKQTVAFILKADVCHRTSNRKLFSFEHFILDIIMKIFVKSLSNNDVRKKIIRELINFDRSLKEVFNLTKNVDRVKKKLKKLQKKNRKIKELLFYRELIEKNMSKEKIASFMTFYHNYSFFSKWIYELNSRTNQQKFQSSMQEQADNNQNKYKSLIDDFDFFNQYSNRSRSFSSDFVESRVISDVNTFKNSYINENFMYSFDMSVLCVKCDVLKHIFRDCNESSLFL